VRCFATGSSTLSPTHEQTCALLATGVIRCWGDNAQGEIGNGTTIDQTRPTAVNSFAANVDPAPTLHTPTQAVVTALVDCNDGDEVHLSLRLSQGAATGSAFATARCADRLVRVPMHVEAHGDDGMHAGAATVQIEAVVRRHGDIVDDTHWTREIVLSAAR